MSATDPLVMFIIVKEDRNWDGYWDPILDRDFMQKHGEAAVALYNVQPNTNYMVTITNPMTQMPYYLFQEVLDPKLMEYLNKKR